ncbi:hypothetical protein BJ165DRAFT_1521290 [Panaeolus papilionaceus]|nr:hypothetical protein BJ165DRAFT_1521290 [Panaeolus papilionaceus]
MSSQLESSLPSKSFQDRLKDIDHLKPGPEYFEARRKLWLEQTSNHRQRQHPQAVQNLVELLDDPNAVYSRYTWDNSLRKIWKNLSTGAKLKHNFPLNLLIKLLHAAWMRDDTWPPGAIAPDSDDERQAAADAAVGQIPVVP